MPVDKKVAIFTSKLKLDPCDGDSSVYCCTSTKYQQQRQQQSELQTGSDTPAAFSYCREMRLPFQNTLSVISRSSLVLASACLCGSHCSKHPNPGTLKENVHSAAFSLQSRSSD